jgi:hypothetical protein
VGKILTSAGLIGLMLFNEGNQVYCALLGGVLVLTWMRF